MGKETKEMLKAINANLELIMKHLNIAKPVGISHKKETKVEGKKPAVKNAPAKKAIGQKK
jgi:hypothetical protein